MRRFFISPDSLQGKRIIFTGKDAHYITRVLRLRRGESILAFDGRGTEYSAVIGIISPRRVEAIISGRERKEPVRPYSLALAQSVLKGTGLDLVIRQNSELGLSEFYPLINRRSVGRPGRGLERKLERWEKIALDAARQSGQSVAPRIHPFIRWEELLLLASRYSLRLLPWEKEERGLKVVLENYSPASSREKILVAVGPEGGFSESEVTAAVEAGFQTVSLGPTTLRAATAGVVALAAIHYHFQEAER